MKGKNMKIKLFILMMVFGWPFFVFAADPAVVFVRQVTDDVIEQVITADKTPEEKLALFQEKFNEALDLKTIGQFVLGVYWKKASSEERDAFMVQFRDFTTKTWLDRFNLYDGQKFIFSGTRNAERGQFYVDSQVQMNPPVEVIWRLRQKEGTYKIIDIIVEGVSMAMSYRNEYSAFLQKHGGKLTTLIDELQRKNKEFVLSSKGKSAS